MMRPHRRPLARLGPLPLGAAVALGLAACAGSSPGTSASGPAPLATAPATPSGSASAGASATPTGAAPVAAGGEVTVLAPLGLNMRSSPSLQATVVGRLGQGATLTVLGHQTGWYHVQGHTVTGWVSDDLRYLSPRHFNQFSSQTKGFSLLYPDTWTFADGQTSTTFQPQSGAQVLVVLTGPTLDALGQPGRPGYGAVDSGSIEVYGVTGTIRYYDRGAAAPPGTSAPLPGGATAAATATPAAGLAHLAEVRIAVTKQYAMRIDFEYSDPVDLAVFQDMVDSVYLVAASVTPTAGTSPTP